MFARKTGPGRCLLVASKHKFISVCTVCLRINRPDTAALYQHNNAAAVSHWNAVGGKTAASLHMWGGPHAFKPVHVDLLWAQEIPVPDMLGPETSCKDDPYIQHHFDRLDSSAFFHTRFSLDHILYRKSLKTMGTFQFYNSQTCGIWNL